VNCEESDGKGRGECEKRTCERESVLNASCVAG